MVGGEESAPSLQQVWEQFRRDPRFEDLEILEDLRVLRRAVVYVLREYPKLADWSQVQAVRNVYLALGGRKRGKAGVFREE